MIIRIEVPPKTLELWERTIKYLEGAERKEINAELEKGVAKLEDLNKSTGESNT
jgi:hypothetical protein